MTEVKQMVNKRVKIKKHEVLQKKEEASIPKWKNLIAKIFKIPVATRHRYLFRVEYYGSAKLRPNDVVTDDNNVIYTVLQEANRLAMVLTYKTHESKPSLHGQLTIQGREIKKQ